MSTKLIQVKLLGGPYDGKSVMVTPSKKCQWIEKTEDDENDRAAIYVGDTATGHLDFTDTTKIEWDRH